MTRMSGQGRRGSRRCGAAASPRPSDAGPTSAAAAAHGVPATGSQPVLAATSKGAKRCELVTPSGIASVRRTPDEGSQGTRRTSNPSVQCPDMNKKPVTEAIMWALADEVTKQLDLAKRIDHPGESGRAREQILTSFIHRLVPSTFGVATGFVVDAVGGLSKQIDIVVYRNDYAPIFEIGGVKHFLVESVIAVLEVKAAITSIARLNQALENIRSVKCLDRSNGGKNYILAERNQGQQVSRDEFRHQVFGAIVTEHSLSRDVLREQLLSFLRTHPRREWPNTYVDVNDFVAAYMRSEDHPTLWADPNECTHLWLQHPNSETYRGVTPLFQLAYFLIDLFRVVPLIDFEPLAYLPTGIRTGDGWPIEQ